jgi:IS30 family transposase
MGRTYDQLSMRERMMIDLWLREGLSQRRIAMRLGRAPSTIGREIRRNARPTKSWSGGYDGERADGLAARRRRWDARYKMARQPALADEVRKRLAMGLSPEQVAGRLTLEHGRTIVSHESIYRFIYHRAGQRDRSWYRLLPRAKHRRGRLARRGGSLARLIKARIPITERPHHVATRQEPGHWEADLMIFGRNARALLVVHERTSRFTAFRSLPDKTAATVRDRLAAFFQDLPKPLRRSVTFDNGGEFALHHHLGVDTYFCDPHAPWQKGGIENAIGRIRRRLPRNTDLADLHPDNLQTQMAAYNDTPRKVIGFRTPAELFSHFKAVALQP